MYSVVNGGEVIGFCDKPRYVRSKNGIYVEVAKEDATHVAIGGVAYDLEETFVREVDSGEITFHQNERLTDVKTGVDDSQDAICALSEEMESRIADVEDAICALTEEV